MLGELIVKISADMDNFTKSMETVGQKLDSASKKFTDVGKTLSATVTAPILAMSAGAIKLASDMEETLNKVNVSFGKNADTVLEWSKGSIKSMGLAQASALEATALFGDFATGMGLTKEEATGMSMNLTQLGADLSSFKNIPVDQAMTALKGVFTGETESLKGLGVVMTQTNLEAFALSQGIQTNIKDMTEAEKINLRYAFVMNATQNAQGDFARTSEGSANQMKIFQQTLIELGTQFGSIMLPLFTEFILKVNEIVGRFMALDEGAKTLILIIAGVVASIGPFLLIIGQVINAISILNTVMLFLVANPFSLILVAIVAVIGGLVYFYNTNEKVKNFIDSAWTSIQQKFRDFLNFFTGIFKNDVEQSSNALLSIFNIFGEGVATTISEKFTFAFEKAKEIFTGIKLFLEIVLNEILAFFMPKIQMLVEFWNENGAQLLKAFTNIFTFIYNVVKIQVDKIISYIKFWIPTIQDIFINVWTFIKNFTDAIFKIMIGIFKVFIGIFTGDWRKAWEGVKDIFIGIFNGIKAFFEGIINGIITGINVAIRLIEKLDVFGLADNISEISLIGEKDIGKNPMTQADDAKMPSGRSGDFSKTNNVYLDSKKVNNVLAPSLVDSIQARMGSAY